MVTVNISRGKNSVCRDTIAISTCSRWIAFIQAGQPGLPVLNQRMRHTATIRTAPTNQISNDKSTQPPLTVSSGYEISASLL